MSSVKSIFYATSDTMHSLDDESLRLRESLHHNLSLSYAMLQRPDHDL